MRGKVIALVGAQYGSEGKGLILGRIANQFPVHVRVGAANAGHTVWVAGEKHVMQQLPCAAYANPQASCVLGAGAMISVEILEHEIALNKQWREERELPPLRLFIDPRAHVVLDQHIADEAASDLAERIGSTSTIAREGIGAAQAARVMRSEFKTAQDWAEECGFEDGRILDTVEHLHQALAFGTDVLLEGTQGTGLSNTTGQYPFVTSRNTTVMGLAGDCGIGPHDIDRIILVARTFPIRVAGNSGPFWHDAKEIDWEQLGVDPENERTTVTKKIRRVSTFSMDQVAIAARLNSATDIALTFCDYLDPRIRDLDGEITWEDLKTFDHLAPMIEKITQVSHRTKVTMLGTGPQTVLDVIGQPDEPETALQDGTVTYEQD